MSLNDVTCFATSSASRTDDGSSYFLTNASTLHSPKSPRDLLTIPISTESSKYIEDEIISPYSCGVCIVSGLRVEIEAMLTEDRDKVFLLA